MSLGSLWLRLRSTFSKGVRVAYYRDIIRPRILKTPPICGTADKAAEIHVLTSAKDWLDLMWALKSFYIQSGRHYGLCIHDDGSLEAQQTRALQQHFPQARIITRPQADAEVLPTLATHPRCQAFRKSNHLSPKIFDFRHYLHGDRMFLLDSDVLFFEEPYELLNRIESGDYQKNTVNGDVSSAYTVDPAVVLEKSGIRLIDRFNSGLGLIHRDSLRLDWLEEFLGLPGVLGHFWRIEQTLFALCSCRHGVELLPPEYDVHLEGGIGGSPSRHYVGAIRHLLYREGIRRLVKEGFLKRTGAACG